MDVPENVINDLVEKGQFPTKENQEGEFRYTKNKKIRNCRVR